MRKIAWFSLKEYRDTLKTDQPRAHSENDTMYLRNGMKQSVQTIFRIINIYIKLLGSKRL